MTAEDRMNWRGRINERHREIDRESIREGERD